MSHKYYNVGENLALQRKHDSMELFQRTMGPMNAPNFLTLIKKQIVKIGNATLVTNHTSVTKTFPQALRRCITTTIVTVSHSMEKISLFFPYVLRTIHQKLGKASMSFIKIRLLMPSILFLIMLTPFHVFSLSQKNLIEKFDLLRN